MKDERLSRPAWLVTYRNKVPPTGVEPVHVSHPSTNRARRRVLKAEILTLNLSFTLYFALLTCILGRLRKLATSCVNLFWRIHSTQFLDNVVVRSLLRAGVKPTLDPSAETFMSVQCASPGRGGELVGVCSVCASCVGWRKG